MTTSTSTPTVNPNDHVAAAVHLMKHESVTALIVLSGERSDRPMGIITDTDIDRAVTDGKDLNEARIYDLMDTYPDRHPRDEEFRDAAKTMLTGRFRPLPVEAETNQDNGDGEGPWI